MAQAQAEAEPPSTPAPEPRAEPVASSPPAGEPAAAQAAGASIAGVREFVESWRSAWQAQDVEAYLDAYSRDFRPESGLGRAAWERQRRQRLAAPSFIEIAIAYVEPPQVDGDRAVVRFLQSYESNTFSDTVTKRLELVREGGEWKIAAEKVDS